MTRGCWGVEGKKEEISKAEKAEEPLSKEQCVGTSD